MVVDAGPQRDEFIVTPTIDLAENADPPDVSVVLPCLNEAASVALCVKEALTALDKAEVRGEVIVVDNGSTDGSPEIARAAGARVVLEGRPGYGRAVRTGIESARGEIVVMGDADWSYDFQKLPEVIEPLLNGTADLVLGSRLDGATRRSMPVLHRYIGTPLLSLLIRRAAGDLSVTDSQTGYRAFRRDVALAMRLETDGMELASAMLIRFGQAGLRVLEVPTGYRERMGSSKLNTLRDGIRHLRLISLLAPQIVLLIPGALALSVGVLLSAFSLASPAGLEVGSVRWQPIFFSTIAIVLGLQGVLLGTVLTHQSALASPGIKKRFEFVGRRAFPRACTAVGLVAFLAGIALDAVLFVRSVWATPDFYGGLALASTAQSLLIGGGTIMSFGFVVRWLYWGQHVRLRELSSSARNQSN
jgi:hypothetical protein